MKGAVTAAAVVVLLTGCSGGDEPAAQKTTQPTPSETAGATFTPPPGVEVTELDAGPVGVADVGGTAWAVLPGPGVVRTGAGATVPVGTAPLRLVATPDGVWVSVIGDGRLVRIDPGAGKVDLRTTLRPSGSEPEGLAYDGRSVWVVDQAGDRILPLDPATGELGRPVAVGHHPRLVSSGPSAVWVGNYDGGSVTRVRAGRATTVELDTCLTPQGLAEAAGVIWVACTLEGRVVGLDTESLEVVASFDGLEAADAILADRDTVYAVGQVGPTVWAIDARRRAVVTKLVLDEVGATRENVGAALVGRRLVVSHPDVFRLYDVPLALLR